MDPLSMFGMTLIAIFSLFLSAGYLGLIIQWANGVSSGLKRFMARGGTASLSAYLMQGLIMSLIFNHYGLGFFGEWGAFACIMVAVAASILSLVFVSLWRTKMALGPVEMLLRRFTYWRGM